MSFNFFNIIQKDDTSEILLLDWQTARMGSPMLDVMYYLFTSTERSLRDQHLDELLRVYHTACCGVITACGSVAEQLFTFEQLQQQMGEFGIQGFAMATLIVGIMVSESENILDMDEYANEMDAKIKNGEDPKGYFLKFDERSKALFGERFGAVIDDAIRLKCVKLLELENGN